MMMVVNIFLYVFFFRILCSDFLGDARKIKLQALVFNVGLRYRKSTFREEASNKNTSTSI